MARIVITKKTIPTIKDEGYNLIQSTDFTTLVPGAGNGVRFSFDKNTIVVFKNKTGGVAKFSVLIPEVEHVTKAGGSIVSPLVTVNNNDHVFYKVARVFIQKNNQIYIECDVAAEILLLDSVI